MFALYARSLSCSSFGRPSHGMILVSIDAIGALRRMTSVAYRVHKDESRGKGISVIASRTLLFPDLGRLQHVLPGALGEGSALTIDHHRRQSAEVRARCPVQLVAGSR